MQSHELAADKMANKYFIYYIILYYFNTFTRSVFTPEHHLFRFSSMPGYSSNVTLCALYTLFL